MRTVLVQLPSIAPLTVPSRSERPCPVGHMLLRPVRDRGMSGMPSPEHYRQKDRAAAMGGRNWPGSAGCRHTARKPFDPGESLMGRIIRAKATAGMSGIILLTFAGCGYGPNACLQPAEPNSPVAPEMLTPPAGIEVSHYTPLVEAPSAPVSPPDEFLLSAPAEPAAAPEGQLPDNSPAVWGIVGRRGFMLGDHVAPNGVEFKPLFSLDLDFNLWLWRARGPVRVQRRPLLGAEGGPRASPTPARARSTSASASSTSTSGVAWNYYGNWEARAFAYSFNNLNRGTSLASPTGFNDGVGLENRYYLGPGLRRPGHARLRRGPGQLRQPGLLPDQGHGGRRRGPVQTGPVRPPYLTWDLLRPQGVPVRRWPGHRGQNVRAQTVDRGRRFGSAAVRPVPPTGVSGRDRGHVGPPTARDGNRGVRQHSVRLLANDTSRSVYVSRDGDTRNVNGKDAPSQSRRMQETFIPSAKPADTILRVEGLNHAIVRRALRLAQLASASRTEKGALCST